MAPRCRQVGPAGRRLQRRIGRPDGLQPTQLVKIAGGLAQEVPDAPRTRGDRVSGAASYPTQQRRQSELMFVSFPSSF